MQLSCQRFFSKQALYLTVSEVYFAGYERSAIDPPPLVRHWITTFVAAYERKFFGPVNGVFQLYGSPSMVEGTDARGALADRSSS